MIFGPMRTSAFVISFKKSLYIAYSVEYRNNISLRKAINALRVLAQLK